MVFLSSSDGDINKAAEALAAGLLVAFPTETVYGLGADAFNTAALGRVFEAKGRPRFDPLIIHMADPKSLDRVIDLAALGREARRRLDILSRRFWPGPLTLILPKRRELPDLATSGLPTAAVRFPDHPVAQKLIRLSTGAAAAPSANPFGRLSPTRAEHVRDQLGDKVDYILDGGPARVGVESTVLDLSADEPRLLRPGGTPREQIEELIGPVAAGPPSPPGHDREARRSPGQLTSHYAPGTPLSVHPRETMTALPYDPAEAYLFFDGPSRDTWLAARGFSPGTPGGIPENPHIRVLSERGDLSEAASRLFGLLHELDGLGFSRIRAEEVPGRGLGTAINDRYYRASAR
jgi:L-threonylcarbamoyladenylate synthase